jgi:hypothetical protein
MRDKIFDADLRFIQYLIDNPGAGKRIPAGSVLVFRDTDDADFSREAARIALLNHSLSRSKREQARRPVVVTVSADNQFLIEETTWADLESVVESDSHGGDSSPMLRQRKSRHA